MERGAEDKMLTRARLEEIKEYVRRTEGERIELPTIDVARLVGSLGRSWMLLSRIIGYGETRTGGRTGEENCRAMVGEARRGLPGDWEGPSSGGR